MITTSGTAMIDLIGFGRLTHHAWSRRIGGFHTPLISICKFYTLLLCVNYNYLSEKRDLLTLAKLKGRSLLPYQNIYGEIKYFFLLFSLPYKVIINH